MIKLLFILFVIPTVIYCQKIYIESEGFVTPTGYKDNNFPPPAYSGVYQFIQPAQDEYGQYSGGDGYDQKLIFEIGVSNEKLTESFELDSWENPRVDVIEKFNIIENKFTSENYTGFFRQLTYKTKGGITKEAECLVITENNIEKVFVKI